VTGVLRSLRRRGLASVRCAGDMVLYMRTPTGDRAASAAV
jgi:hypothetical protein